jgi:hypothetical protein
MKMFTHTINMLKMSCTYFLTCAEQLYSFLTNGSGKLREALLAIKSRSLITLQTAAPLSFPLLSLPPEIIVKEILTKLDTESAIACSSTCGVLNNFYTAGEKRWLSSEKMWLNILNKNALNNSQTNVLAPMCVAFYRFF